MRIQVHCFLKERDRDGKRQGAGCRKACYGCSQDIGTIWIGEVPPDYLRGGDHKHKSKKPIRTEEVQDGFESSIRVR